MDPEKQIEELNVQLAAQMTRADEAEALASVEKVRADTAEGKLTDVTIRLDAATEKLKLSESPEKVQVALNLMKAQVAASKKRADEASDPEKFRKAVEARVDLEAKAEPILGERSGYAKMTDRELQIAVIESLHGSVDTKRSDDYVRATFDSAVAGYEQGNAAISRVREAQAEAAERTAAAPRADRRSRADIYAEEQANAWKNAPAAKA
jgi:hypothetical protein